MIDKSKRNTLKAAAVAGVAVATVSFSTATLAAMVKPVSSDQDVSLLNEQRSHSGTVNLIIQNRAQRSVVYVHNHIN